MKLGLLPAVILPYVGRRIGWNHVRRFSLTARVFDGTAAAKMGLVDVVAPKDQLNELVEEEKKLILDGGPRAQGRLKRLLATLADQNFSQGQTTVEAIAEARTSEEGQAGLKAFFAKGTPPWV